MDSDLVQIRHPGRRRRALAERVPFGIGQIKPNHYLEMLRIAWQNRDNLGYAWRVLTEGTCDGCALGTTGLHDWTLGPDETHLCLVRLNLLRLNTMPAIEDFEAKLADVEPLEQLSSEALRELGRIPYPMKRGPAERGFVRITWEQAFEEVGAKIRALKNPDKFALFCTSRGVTNETYYLAQKVARLLGTNNVDNSARLCHSPSTVGLKDTVGVGATTCSYSDLYKADLIVFLGSNPANDQPVALKYLLEAKERGARVVTINTYREPGMRKYWVPSDPASALFGSTITDDFFLVHTGGDLALLNAVQRLLIDRDLVDAGFIKDHTLGFEALNKALHGQELDRLCKLAGVTIDQAEYLSTLIGEAKNGILVWSMGITQHEHGSDTVRAIANLGLLRGWVGRPGVGLMPIRGHSGVQGGAEMGAYATAFPGGKSIDVESARELSDKWGFEVPATPGMQTTRMIEAAHTGKLGVFYILGGNFLETLPQPEWVKEALARVRTRVHQDIVLTKQMLIPSEDTVFIFPARTRYEQRGGGTETSTERRVILSPEIPGHDIGEAMSEWEILMRVAEAARPAQKDKIHFEDADAVRREIGATIPSYAKIADLKEGGDQFQWGGPILCEGGEFPLPGGRARFKPVKPPELELSSDELRLSTRRGKQFNSMVQDQVDPLTGEDRRAVFISQEDARRFDVRDGEEVTLFNRWGYFTGKVAIQPMRPGNVQAHWPEVNSLLPRGRIDPAGGVPDYNAIVRMVPAGQFATVAMRSNLLRSGL